MTPSEVLLRPYRCSCSKCCSDINNIQQLDPNNLQPTCGCDPTFLQPMVVIHHFDKVTRKFSCNCLERLGRPPKYMTGEPSACTCNECLLSLGITEQPKLVHDE